MNSVLTYEPNKWHSCKDNEWECCEKGVNCYSYVLNNPKYYWAVPGLGFTNIRGRKYVDSFNSYFQSMSPEEFRKKLIKGAVNDGLIKTDAPKDCDGYYLAALFFPENEKDFHWYRKDNDTWSHKDGWKLALNKDNENNLIVDPTKDAQKLYPIFGGYFLVPIKGIILTKTFPQDAP